jgi:alpha-galactosidase
MKWKIISKLIAFIVLFFTVFYAQNFEGLAMTLPMGWNSWNTFEVNINEQLIKETAEAIVSIDLQAAGYNYIVIDAGNIAT